MSSPAQARNPGRVVTNGWDFRFINKVVNNLPILKNDESFCSDLDLFLAVISTFEKINLFQNEVISDVSLVGGHMEFLFHGIPVSVFNMSSHLISSISPSIVSQGILDMKEKERSLWKAGHNCACISIIVELGSIESYKPTEYAIAVTAHETNDYRYIVEYIDQKNFSI